MVILSNSDMFEVRINSLLADYDRETLTNLYQPIIGYTALALYFTLWSETNIQKVLSYSTHEQLFTRMKLVPGHFIEARKILEAVGLVKTRLEKMQGANIYHYELLNPKTPQGFFGDTLLYGMLIQALGESDAERIKRVYEINKVQEEDGEDISSSFNEVFHPDFGDDSFLYAATSANNTVGRNKAKIETEFSYEIFFKTLGEVSQINEKAISKKEMKEIERLSTLYGVDAETAAKVVANNYDPSKDKGERVDLKAVNESLMQEANYAPIMKKHGKKSQVSSDTNIAYKIKLMEEKTPLEYLSILQGGSKVASADAKIIDMLSKNYGLSNGVINVIIDFVLSMNQNILSKAYCEKIAASFKREGIETTIDAMNYCNEVLKARKKNKKQNSKNKNNNENKSNLDENNSNNSSKNLKEEWDELFKEEENNEGDDDSGTTDSELPF